MKHSTVEELQDRAYVAGYRVGRNGHFYDNTYCDGVIRDSYDLGYQDGLGDRENARPFLGEMRLHYHKAEIWDGDRWVDIRAQV